MNPKALLIVGCASLLSVVLIGNPAEAAAKKRVVHRTHVVVSQPRVRVRVEPRSYTDAGTEVLPGQRKFTDYALPPFYSPTSSIDNTAFSRPTWSLPGPFDLPGRNGPRMW